MAGSREDAAHLSRGLRSLEGLARLRGHLSTNLWSANIRAGVGRAPPHPSEAPAPLFLNTRASVGSMAGEEPEKAAESATKQPDGSKLVIALSALVHPLGDF